MGAAATELTAEQELKDIEDAFMAGQESAADSAEPEIKDEVIEAAEEAAPEIVEDDQLGETVVEAGDTDPIPEATASELNISDEAMDKIEAALMKKIGRRLHNLEGNVGGFSQKLALMQQAKEKVADAPAEKSKESEEMATLREELPEIASAFDLQARQANQKFAESEQLLNQAGSEIQQLRNMRQLDGSFPGWETTINSDHYQNWVMNQTEQYINVAMNSQNVNDAVQVLSDYHDAHRPLVDHDAGNQELEATKPNTLLADAIAPTRGAGGSTRRRKTAQEEFDSA